MVKYPVGIRVFSNQLGIADWMQLTHERVTFGSIYRISFGIVTVKLEDGGCLGTIINHAPTSCRDVLECAVE